MFFPKSQTGITARNQHSEGDFHFFGAPMDMVCIPYWFPGAKIHDISLSYKILRVFE